MRALAGRILRRAKLAIEPPAQFDTTNLRKDFDVAAAMTAPLNSWPADSAHIQTLYPPDERSFGVNPGDRRALYYLAHALKPARILELGTNIGASTVHLAACGAHTTTIDILDVNAKDAAWKQAGLIDNPLGMTKRLGLNVEFVTAPGADFMRATKERYDLIFLDGDHSALAVYREVGLALRILNPGGIIVLHDYHPTPESIFPGDDIIDGPKLAMRRITREASIRAVALGCLPWPTKRGRNITSLALVLH